MLIGAAASCGLYDSSSEDAAPGLPDDTETVRPDSGTDALTPLPSPSFKCNRARPFGAPVLVPGLTAVPVEGATLSADELVIYFSIAASDGKRDLFSASRPSSGDPFGPPVPLSPLNTADDDTCAAVSPSTTELVFVRAATNEAFHLFYASRASPAFPFGPPVKLATLSTGGNEITPFLLANGTAMYFTSFRTGTGDIYRAGRSGSSFDPPTLVGGIATADWDSSPVVTDDELVIIYTSMAGDTNPNGFERFNIWTASRTSATAPFVNPRRIDALNTAQADAPAWLSRDECRLYLQSSRTGAPRLYVSERAAN